MTGEHHAGVCVFAPAPLLTVTIEPAPDSGEELHVHAGGQGFWVARMVKVLGERVVVCAPLGGETGGALAQMMGEAAGMDLRRIPVGQPSGAYVHDRRGGERRELWQAKLGALRRHEVDDLSSATLAAGLECGVCVLTGTHRQASVVPLETYRQLAADLRANGAEVICDVQGDILRAVLDGGVNLVKVSDAEIAEDGWAPGSDPHELAAGMRALVAAGAEDVVVSRAEGGALAFVAGAWLELTAPEMTAVEPSGAGDSMTGALAVARSRGLAAHDALRLAVAAGAVNVTRRGLGSGHADAIAQVARNVQVSELEAHAA